ncbi:MAG: hypothetical protein IKY72_07225 [Bacteroidaceae bacterium]|nr:hypothetical protein [Bacteroidaceae bacterium]
MANNDKTNVILVVLSVLLPLIGYILYFVKREDAPDAAKNYLYAAIAGSVVGLLLAV